MTSHSRHAVEPECEHGSGGAPKGALAGVRVLDMSRVLAGPWCTQTLGDLGADVIKIERPGNGDDTRAWGPPYLHDAEGKPTQESAYFLGANRNKRSVALNIAHPLGQHVLRDLVLHSDVVVENFKVGDLARYGLDPRGLLSLKPSLVVCSITGFGQTGPYRHRAGYDYAIQGMGGLMSITGERDDLPGGGPQKVGVAVADLFTGQNACIAILAALRHRDLTGEGQLLDIALLDSQVAMLANMASNYLVSGVSPRRMGNAHANIVPYQVFEASDGHFIVAVGNDTQFAKLAQIAGRPQWAQDPRFATNQGRVRERGALLALMDPVLGSRTRQEWLTAMEDAGIPCGPINDLAEVFADPHVQSRRLVAEAEHPTAGTIRIPVSPLKMSATPPQVRYAPPMIGQHTREVLAEAGLGEAQIDALFAAGVVA